MKKLALLSGAIILLVPAAPSPASAATPAPTVILDTTCSDGYLGADTVAAAKGTDGKAHGFATFRYSSTCGDKITYFEGSGTSWTVKSTPLVGKVVDVAADNTGTYLLYIIHEIDTAELAIAKRANDGTFTRTAVVAPVTDTATQDGRGSIVAKNGTWYAVWPQYGGAAGKYVLYQAETMFGGGGDPGQFYVGTPTTPASTDTHPVLAMSPDGQPRLFWQRAVSGGRQDLLVSVGAYGAWNDATRVAKAVSVSSQYPALDMAVTDKRTFLSWTVHTDTGDIAVVGTGAGTSTGTFTASTPPADPNPASWDAHIQASATSVFAAFGTGDGPPGDAFTGHKNGSAAWAVDNTAHGVPGSIDTFGVAALIYTGGGKSTALLYSGHQLYAFTR